MAAGLPIVATNVGAVEEMIDREKGGLLVEPGDCNGMAEAIRSLCRCPQRMRSMGEHNKRKCRSEYLFSIVIQKLIRIYDCVLHEKVAGTKLGKRRGNG